MAGGLYNILISYIVGKLTDAVPAALEAMAEIQAEGGTTIANIGESK